MGLRPGPLFFMTARSHSLGLGVVISDAFEGLLPLVC